MSNLIDRQAMLKYAEKKRKEALMMDDLHEASIIMAGMDLLEEAARNLPSAGSEIIRCRDCKYWDFSWRCSCGPGYYYCPMIDMVTKGDFYCADAERRTDE